MAALISLLTDFGDRDGYVGIMKGVMLRIAPTATIVDLAHGIAPQDVLGAALVLESAVDHFPTGTIHVAVVDPGVGSQRAAIVIETREALFIGPDNGVLSLAVAPQTPHRAFQITASVDSSLSNTFHGRDLFAPTAARLARGDAIESLAEARPAFHRLPVPLPICEGDALRGEVISIDHFGNLITNLRREAHPEIFGSATAPRGVEIEGIGTIPGATHYAAGSIGEALALWNSWNRLEIAVREGSAQQRLGATRGTPVTVRRR